MVWEHGGRVMMLSRKKRLALGILTRSGATALGAWVRARLPSEVPILAYHRVCEVPEEDAYPFDIELVSASPAAFRRQMVYVRERYTPITCATLIAALRGEIPLPARPVIVTFEDGFDDNYRYAFPILKALRMPATVFLSTGYIGGERTFWFDELAHQVLTTGKDRLDLDDINVRFSLGNGPAARRAAVGQLLKYVKSISNAARLQLLDRLREELGACHDDTGLSRPLTWQQVREMADGGIEFGAHTVSHPILSQLGEEELRHELEESRRTIERHLGSSVQALSYPVGGSSAFSGRERRAAREAGYTLAVSYMHGINRIARLDKYGLRRLHVERYMEDSWFAAMMIMPGSF
jgi:peptidoglycan/xylan/chitin deacetylase (PgdA/CDA1 family)